ncbi:L-alanine exporter AlaE [Moritella sp. F3]|uniref:L-alanine exporter AlaE n=1 Tax=Moritella sp. F3 TaxID=2718882 RepID=UPI0018E1C4D9|nr:L-alanine exporter AlaE [Moritella sp. F3]GIC79165.1 L-alanine exporter AlaE [Moritella sp. F1]GIC83485.1 L-alanine exporter AlaE [Moritella sp. F3]
MQVKAPFCVRNAAADTFAMVVFSFVVGMLIEIFISGMSFQQSLASRMVSIPVNIAIAYPYGLYRDVIIKNCAKLMKNKLSKQLGDTFAYVSFQSPVYALILLSVGADFAQIVTAVSSNAVVSCFVGVFYGQFLDLCRKLFRVPGYHAGISA